MVMEALDPQTIQIAQAMVLALQASQNIGRTKALNGGHYQQKDVSYNANTQYAHGPRGVFNLPGVEPDMWSLVRRPKGLAGKLPIVKSRYTSNFYGLPIYVAAGSGAEPANDCAPGPNPGDLNIAYQSFPFGKVIRTTTPVDVNRVGQLVNNAEPLDLRIINAASDSSPFVPDPARNPTFLTSELGLKYWTLGIEFERQVESDIFTGDPTNNNALTAGRQYFAGLDKLINTGKIDANTGVAVPALDSLLVNWAGADISGTVTLGGRSADIVSTISAIINYLEATSMETNIQNPEWELNGRYDLFYALTAIWPCSYLTNGCTTAVNTGGTSMVFVSGSEQVGMRDEMRTGQFLWINGRRYAWNVTDQNTETTTAGRRSSDIYFTPMSANGRRPLYLESFPFDNEQINEFVNTIPGQMWQSNNGLYFWTFDKTQYCVTLTAKVQPRLILRLPQIAARLRNVGYTALIPTLTGNTGGLYPQPTGGASVGSYQGALYAGY
jgi:hypothetical protein